jgi:aspartate aminotransferase/aminotransferase
MSKRTQAMSVSGIRKVFEMAQKIKNPIDLSIGQPDFSVPDKIKKHAIKAIQEDKNGYTPTFGLMELRTAIAEKLQKSNKIKKAIPENTIITSAVSGGISVVLPAIINSGDEVIIFDPYFVSYKQQVLLYSGKPVIVRKNENFSLNIDNLKKAITNKTKAIILNTPENPTGYVWKKEELEKLAKIAEENNLTIISDEIYEDFIYNKNRPHISIASFYKNTVTLGGFSKSYAVTGWRVGWLQAPQKIIQEIMKVQQYTFVCAPTPFQYACLVALNCNISKYVNNYKKRSELLYNGLKGKYFITRPQGAFYFFVKYPYNPEKFITDCLNHNLLIIPGNVFSEENIHFRLSFATSKQNIQKAIKILNKLANTRRQQLV